VPIQRDDEEERLARIERIIEDLRRNAGRSSVEHRKTIEEARLLRERSQAVRRALRKLRFHSGRQTKKR
jgi:hypothetical protein